MDKKTNLYHEMRSFRNFDQAMRDRHYKKIPDDWVVFVADIEGSTKAIEMGRYKDVNTLGAACIIAAQNAMNKREFPYVFGGDGATFVIPPEDFKYVAAALDGVRKTSILMFNMTLRVGFVRLEEIRASGCYVEVAKYELCAGKSIALFRGGGLSKADSFIKGAPEKYGVKSDPNNESDLTGLSCRWEPIPSENGKVLTLLVSATSVNPNETYQKVLDRLTEVLNGNMGTANPVHISNMNYRTIFDNLKSEWRYHTNHLSFAFLSRVFEIFASMVIFQWKIPPLFFDAKHYANAMADHSDFRKFDDVLRLVLDCSLDQIVSIKKYLGDLHSKGDVCYGTHESDVALMTCFVYDVSDGGHIHFVDGGDGGYAMAAKQFKEQLKT